MKYFFHRESNRFQRIWDISGVFAGNVWAILWLKEPEINSVQAKETKVYLTMTAVHTQKHVLRENTFFALKSRNCCLSCSFRLHENDLSNSF